jgi:hypothetical protein
MEFPTLLEPVDLAIKILTCGSQYDDTSGFNANPICDSLAIFRRYIEQHEFMD